MYPCYQISFCGNLFESIVGAAQFAGTHRKVLLGQCDKNGCQKISIARVNFHMAVVQADNRERGGG